MLRTGRIHDKKLFSFQMFRRRIKHHTASSNNIKHKKFDTGRHFENLGDDMEVADSIFCVSEYEKVAS